MAPLHATRSAAALALGFEDSEPTPSKDVAGRSEVATETRSLPAARKSGVYQPSLFTPREMPRVVPFETIAPGSIQRAPKGTVSRPRVRRPRVVPGQQSLDFTPAAQLRRPVDGVIGCGVPVAIPAHRAIAAAIDGSIILIGLGIFASIFQLMGGRIEVNAKTLPLLLIVAAIIAGFYKYLWFLGNGDTPGMRWSGLRLVNFDGQIPDRKQRFYRLGSGFLSLSAAGLGLLWSLVDEEALTWHDHISRTFPTPY